ncbi:hypothetical protein [Ligilactobacillus equi]|uniref:Lipoprotein n=1 Tax=Ligilactobacillus equi DPC 6820 TaxID=1392007 RepID=V7HXR4_9LACO|nr:hypothetical protein [Ligilactobacillus equi]ETA73821.1 hypothetical protein LEQ_0920 [Ligilactobacillus equi DPC 6820]
MKLKKISLLYLPILTLSLVLGACGSDQAQDQSSATSSTTKVAAKAKSSNNSQVTTKTSNSTSMTSASNSATSQSSSSASQVTSESETAATSSSQVTGVMQYAPQALAKAAKDNNLDSSELYVTADGDILSVHENHAKMIENGKDVDPSVNPVIAAYTVSNGQLVSAY